MPVEQNSLHVTFGSLITFPQIPPYKSNKGILRMLEEVTGIAGIPGNSWGILILEGQKQAEQARNLERQHWCVHLKREKSRHIQTSRTNQYSNVRYMT